MTPGCLCANCVCPAIAAELETPGASAAHPIVAAFAAQAAQLWATAHALLDAGGDLGTQTRSGQAAELLGFATIELATRASNAATARGATSGDLRDTLLSLADSIGQSLQSSWPLEDRKVALPRLIETLIEGAGVRARLHVERVEVAAAADPTQH